MVNTKEFTKRLHRIMDFYELSAASFADKIDVGRSSISHLLSGRNKPSLDFVMKIINAFPEVELYWLLNGKGEFPRNGPEGPPLVSSPSTSSPSPMNDLFSQESKEKAPETQLQREGVREIKKIVIFYTDGTFEAYNS